MAEASVTFAQPAEELRPFIPAYWDVAIEGEGIVEDLLRPEWTNIRLVNGGEWAFGPSRAHLAPLADRAIVHGVASHVQWVRGSAGMVFCVPVFPMGWHRLLDARASRYANAIRPLSDILGSDGDRLFNAVMAADSLQGRVAAADAFFLERLSRTKRGPVSERIEAVSLAIADPDCATVAELSARTGLSQPQLARLTRQHFGFSPKRLMRRERFLRMLHSMQGMSVGEWPHFLDPQYSDQSHMIRDFKHFIGMAPTRYFAMERPLLTAVFKTLMRLIAEGNAEGLTIEEGRQTLAFRPDSG
ncbi:MAG: AraC family transcriptional regulator [Sphingomonadaceae bacterium]|nr:AraC family transcriptional regulator [Sphingomonadaceae bacterium]